MDTIDAGVARDLRQIGGIRLIGGIRPISLIRPSDGKAIVEAITDDEIAAAVLAIHAQRQRTVSSGQGTASGWQRTARAEAIGESPAGWRAAGGGR